MNATDVLDTIREGLNTTLFTLNETPVTVSSIFMFIVVMGVFVLVSRLVRRILSKWLLARIGVAEATRFTMLRVIHYLTIVIGAIIAFQFVGIDLSGLAVIFGLLSVGIGFGLQNLTSNFVSGLILLFEQPIRVGDRVTVGDTEGNVEAINMRSTTVRSLNNISIIVPNAEFISSTVINWSHGDPKVRLHIGVGVSYNSDLETVIRCLEEAASENPNVLPAPKPEVLFREFGDSSWNMRLLAWIDDPKQVWRVTSQINCAIVGKFRESGVEIPYPQRDLHVRSSVPVPVGTAEA
jgi:small-conductance mechanosensitive channel